MKEYDHDYCHLEIPNEDDKILKYNQGEKSLNDPAIIYADFDCYRVEDCMEKFCKDFRDHAMKIINYEEK